MQAKKGDWVQIHFIALNPEERSEHLPDDTKKLPLEIRIKGFLEDKEAELNEIVTIKTPIGRLIKGRLEKINPRYEHNFGEPIPELLHINSDILKIGDVDE
ncbi:2-amino-4-oxopentanoate thiolase subunit OrtA [Petrotoga sp. 9PWA.NaAc.5.4]|uniref:2-amino-4-oxopentanoate thiolase subunit OrtA n=1 Tax=Petrotoga sp. 9PWA.NaAc.5.4 TaxID=1434328 RepID=UPI000CB00B5D|nr:2-amino-4-oxopentanoate thiolase subunit OrtA [Petrotoga sp. 9PWA.NaAc.5.4]PNR96684.1 2-amino-4-ketopentanoate thiolase subunit alpha [Petrotoga sp. 9PWA.NaAc.5.4]